MGVERLEELLGVWDEGLAPVSLKEVGHLVELDAAGSQPRLILCDSENILHGAVVR